MVLGIMSLGPGFYWSPKLSKTHTESTQGWSATPLPGSVLEAKSKLNTFSLGLAISGQPPMTYVAKGLFPPIQLSYVSPRLSQPLYLVYSRLQSDGG